MKNGSIGLHALYVNPLTGLATAAEMSHFTDFARQLSAEDSIPITTALVSDIPGFTWGIVSALAQSGVKYFASAPNSGDRIGFVIQEWGDKPFYWTSQSGEEKVLMWVAAASYSMFHEGDLSRLGDEKMLKFIRNLDEKGYPYSIVYLPYTLGDNGVPDAHLSDFVKKWNERYSSPRLIIATHEQMFKEFERCYGTTLPTMKGDFTPYWEDGAASTAYETALNRQATDRLIQGEALWSTLAPKSYPQSEYAAAWKNVVLYDEHTWGASNSVTDPDSPSVKAQWEIKRKFALQADSLARSLLKKALPPPSKMKPHEFALDVYNTGSRPRRDLIVLSKEQSPAGDRVEDEKGRQIPSQRLTSGELAIVADNVPPYSANRYVIKNGKALSRGKAKASKERLENSSIALRLDKKTGAIKSFRWKTNNIELVDTTKSVRINQYVYVLGKNPDSATGLTNVKIKVKERGPLVASLSVEADAPGCNRYSSEIRVIDGINRVDIIDNLDKRSVREKEGVHIAFSFAVPHARFRYDVADGIVHPQIEQLPGSCKNFYSVQSWVDASNNAYGVTLATPDAPLVEIGAINAEQPWMKSIRPSPVFFSYVMNNYWHTNYKADQEGPVTFHYSIVPHEQFNGADAVRFGIEQRQPLIVTAADLSTHPATWLVRVDPAEILVTSIKPINNGNSWLMRIYNTADHDQFTRLIWNITMPITYHQSDYLESDGSLLPMEFSLPAFGTRLIRVDRQAGH